jgi:hypothetical protein
LLLELIGGAGRKPEKRSGSTGNPGAAEDKGGTLLYVSGTMHIETKRTRWPEPDALVAFFRRATATGMRWSVGADIGWLDGEPRAAEVIRATEALGVQWDDHAHRHQDCALCAVAIARFGGHPTTVASGVLLDEVEALREPVRVEGASWEAEILWGTNARSGHGPGADLPAIGVWRPSRRAFEVHDPEGDLIAVGGGPLGLADLETLAREVAGVSDGPPVLSASIMVAPSSLTLVRGNDGIEQIEAWAARMRALPAVRWATIAETAAAWKEAGGVPSRREVDAEPAGPPPRRRR